MQKEEADILMSKEDADILLEEMLDRMDILEDKRATIRSLPFETKLNM